MQQNNSIFGNNPTNNLFQDNNIPKQNQQEDQAKSKKNEKNVQMIFMEKRRDMYLRYQQNDRDSILKKSRQLKFNLEGKQQQQEDQEDLRQIEEKQKKEENLEDLFNQTIDIEKKPEVKPKISLSQQKKIQNQYYADSLVQPEFMVDVPLDLHQNYFLLPRPNGQRCLVFTKDGYATCRDKNGIFFGKYNTQFKNNCILDCFHHKNQNLMYIIDAIQLSGQEIAQETTEFRQFMLNQHVEDYNIIYDKEKNEKQFIKVPCLETNVENLRQYYCSQYPFIKEGIQFVHKQAAYVGGMHPNFLIFKDKFCSMHPIELAPDNQNNEMMIYAVLQAVTLKNDNQMYFQTFDKVTIASISKMQAEIENIKEGDLIKSIFSKISVKQQQEIDMEINDNMSNNNNSSNNQQCQQEEEQMEYEDNIQTNQAFFKEGAVQVEIFDFQITGKSSLYKQHADSLSKLIFQYKIRNDPLKYDLIIKSVEAVQAQKIENE